MWLLKLLLYALILVVAQAALDAIPGVLTVREGGMGLGSALIVAQSAQVAALVVGAVVAAFVVDRGLMTAAAPTGAVLVAIGLLLVAVGPGEHQDHADLGSLLFAYTLGGAGFGMLLTAAFAQAAVSGDRARPLAIGVLLLAPLAARALIGVVYTGEGTALAVAAGIAVVAALVVGALAWRSSSGGLARRRSIRAPALGGLALGIGSLLALLGADASRVSAALVAAPFGLADFASLDAVRAVLAGAGLVLMVIGAATWIGGRRLDRPSLVAAAGVALVALTAGGIIATLTFAAPAGAIVPGERTLPVIAAAPLGGAGLGIMVGAAQLARGSRARMVAVAGAAILAVATLLPAVALTVAVPERAALAGIALFLAAIGFGAGMAASALRLLLADVPVDRRGLAAAAGVVTAAVGSALGTTIGNGEGVAFLTGQGGRVSAGLLLLAVGAGAALACAWLVRLTSTTGAPADVV